MISSHIFLKNQTAHWQTLRRRLKQKLEVNPKLLLDIIHERLLRRNRAAIALNHVLQCHAGAELPQICRHLIPQALLYRCFQKRVVICTANIHIAQNCDVQCVNDLLKCDLAGRSCDDESDMLDAAPPEFVPDILLKCFAAWKYCSRQQLLHFQNAVQCRSMR